MLTLNLYFKKIDGCADNLENSSTTKVEEPIESQQFGYLII